jgi:aspartate aminotransferase-like enzyme
VELDGGSLEALSLFTPGPVDLSFAARRALGRPMIHHRSEPFEMVMKNLGASLKAAFMTTDSVVTLASSGTGAMEAAVVNLFGPGDRVLVPVSGKFSHRWFDICRAFEIDTCVMELAPGDAPEPDDLIALIEREGDIDGVLLTHCETSTGSLLDLEAIGRALTDVETRLGNRILTCVDCITTLCIDEFRKDEWAIDCAIGASQKGLLCPPGLGFISLGGEALKRLRSSAVPRYYFDLRRYLDDLSQAPFTPAVSLVRAAAESLDIILGLGLERVWRANRSGAAALRLLCETAGFEPVARRQAGAVVAFWVGDVDADAMADILAQEHGIVVAHGQGELRGKLLRASAIGKSHREILRFAEAFEATMNKVGLPFVLKDIRCELERIMEDSAIWE